MTRKALPLVALVLSMAALVIVLVRGAHSVSPDTHASALRKAELLEERVKGLEESLVDLTKRQRKMETAVRQTPTVHTVLDPASPALSVAERERVPPSLRVTEVAAVLEPAVAELERKQETLQRELVELGVFEHFEKVQRRITESYAVALNPDLPTKQRLGALPVLREADRIDQDVVTAMIALWDEDGGPRVGYHVMENLEGITDTALRDKILESLQEEEIPKLRGRAVQTLAPMMPDPHVTEWLVYLRENDADRGVRNQAAAALHQTKTSR